MERVLEYVRLIGLRRNRFFAQPGLPVDQCRTWGLGVGHSHGGGPTWGHMGLWSWGRPFWLVKVRSPWVDKGPYLLKPPIAAPQNGEYCPGVGQKITVGLPDQIEGCFWRRRRAR